MTDFSAYGGASPEFTALLSTLPAPTEQTPTELQATNNRVREDVSEQEMLVLSSKVKLQDHTISTPDGFDLEARTYRPIYAPKDDQLPIYIHFHGGGFLFGTLDSENATCSRIADAAGVVVLNVNYRHTPEWVYPAAWLDAEEAFDWAVDNANSFGGDPTQIVVGGISAGGSLTASLAQTLSREGKDGPLKGQVLMIPVTVLADCDWGSMSKVENEFAPILPMSRMKYVGRFTFIHTAKASLLNSHLDFSTTSSVPSRPLSKTAGQILASLLQMRSKDFHLRRLGYVGLIRLETKPCSTPNFWRRMVWR